MTLFETKESKSERARLYRRCSNGATSYAGFVRRYNLATSLGKWGEMKKCRMVVEEECCCSDLAENTPGTINSDRDRLSAGRSKQGSNIAVDYLISFASRSVCSIDMS